MDYEKRDECIIDKSFPNLEVDAYIPKLKTFKRIKLQDLKGHFTVLIFYSGDFGNLPLDELNKFQTVSRKLNEDYNLFALSTDTKEAHEAFCNLEMTEGGLNGLNIPLISDKNAKICKKLNIFDSTSHRAFPSYVLLNKELQFLAKYTSDHSIGGNPSMIVEMMNNFMSLSSKSCQNENDSDEIKVEVNEKHVNSVNENEFELVGEEWKRSK